MKSTSSVCCASAIRTPPSSTQLLRGVSSSCSRSDGRIAKPTACSTTSRISPPVEPETEVEMLACLARLEELVPTVSRYRGVPSPDSDMSEGDSDRQQLSQVQLLQHVIDYILDLENTLDFRPNSVFDATVDITSGAFADPMSSRSCCNSVSNCDDGAVTNDHVATSRSASMSPITEPQRLSTRLMMAPPGELL